MKLQSLITALGLTLGAVAAHAGPQLLSNGNFEISNVGSNGYYYANGATPTVASAPGWTFANQAGIANRSLDWGGMAATSTVVFLQDDGPGGWDAPSASQLFVSETRDLSISFQLAQRPGNQESVRVLLDGIDVVGAPVTPAGADWTSYLFQIGDLTTTIHRLTFVGVDTLGSPDSSLFIDNVSVVSVPEPSTWALGALALAVMGGMAVARKRARQP